MFEIDKQVMENINLLNDKLCTGKLNESNNLNLVRKNLSVFEKSNKNLNIVYKLMCDKIK